MAKSITDLFQPQSELEPEIIDRSTLEKYATCPYQARAVETQMVQDISRPAMVGQRWPGIDIKKKEKLLWTHKTFVP